MRSFYRQVDYDTNEKTDFQYFGPSIDYSHQLNELERVTASLNLTRFIPEEPGEDYTDTISTLFGYGYTSSERFSIDGGLGFAYSMRHEDPGNDTTDIGYRLKFNMKYIMSDQTSARVSLSHDTEPSGDGDQVVRNRVVVGLDHQLTPLTTARLNLDYTDNVDILGFEGDFDDRRGYVATFLRAAGRLLAIDRGLEPGDGISLPLSAVRGRRRVGNVELGVPDAAIQFPDRGRHGILEVVVRQVLPRHAIWRSRLGLG